MKRLALVILSLALTVAFAQSARCAEPADILRVLFLGHDSPHHNSNVYEPLLASALETDGIKFDYFTKTDCLTPTRCSVTTLSCFTPTTGASLPNSLMR